MAQPNTPAELLRRWDRLKKLDGPDLMKGVIAAGIELAVYERKLCASLVANQSDPRTELPRILAAYGEEEAWRYMAHPALERLFDVLAELERRAVADDKTAPREMQMAFSFGDEAKTRPDPL